jgi:hypothetical protein
MTGADSDTRRLNAQSPRVELVPYYKALAIPNIWKESTTEDRFAFVYQEYADLGGPEMALGTKFLRVQSGT